MTIDRIEATATFMINEKYWFKAHWGGTVAENEDPETETLKLKERLEDMYKKIGGTKTVAISEALPVVRVEISPKEAAIESHIEAINGCTSIKSLEIFKKLVDREAAPRLTEAYYKKEQLLSGQ